MKNLSGITKLSFIKGFAFFLTMGLLFNLASCKHDDDDEDLIIDYAPVIFDILVENADGDNLLDVATPNNILDTEMYIELNGERYDVNYGRPEADYYPIMPLTRTYMPLWYGAFIAPYWYMYPDLPPRGNRLFIGEFFGDATEKVTFDLYLDGNTYTIGYLNRKIQGMDVDRVYYLDGQEIESSTFTLTL